MIKLKYLGTQATRIRKEFGGEKIDIKPGDITEVTERMAKEYMGTYAKNFQVVTANVEPKEVMTSTPKPKK